MEKSFESKTVSEYLEACGLVDQVLDGIDSNVTSSTYLATGAEAEFVKVGDTVTFTLPSEPVNQYDTVIEVNLAR